MHKPLTSTPNTRLALRWASAASLLALMLISSQANAQTTSSNWQVSTSIAPDLDDSELEYTVNVGDCRELVDDGDAHSFSFRKISGTFSSTARYSVKVALGNQSCDKNDLDTGTSDECTVLIKDQALNESTPPINVDVELANLTTATTADACEGLSETTYVHLIVLDPQLLETDPTPYSVTFAVIFQCERPSAPNNVTAVGGEESLRVGWDAVTNAEKYKVYYATSAFAEGTRPESLSSVRSIQANSVTSLTVSSGISANSTYYVGVSTIDDDGNESLLSNVVTAETGVVDDFWERYSRENPDLDSGFCFLATAAWGSYQEEHVQVLRDFRDRFLLSNTPGRLFVDAYYAASPPLANFIAKHDTLRAITRTLLYPLYAFAIVMLYSNGWVLAGLALLLCALLVLRRRLRRAGRPSPRLPRFALAAASALLLFVPFAAYAESPIDMVFEVKAGPYTPDQLGSTYDQYFGDDSALVFEFELDYQLYRGIGSAAVGASFGYGGVTGKALTPEGERSIDETSLDWLPLRLQAVYRFDLLAQRFDVPIAFQVKLGLDYYLWWIEDGGGDTAVNEQGEDGYGGTFGWHTAFGISLLLDWLSPTLAKGFDVEWGVNNSYLFAEFLYASIDGFGSSSSLDLSTDGTFQIGLALEF